MTQPEEEQYWRPSELEHLHHRPDVLLGSLDLNNVSEMIWEDGTFCLSSFLLSAGLIQTFREIISNAADAAENAASQKIPFGSIDIFINNKTIRIGNGGIPIRQSWWASENDYTPSVLFGMFRSGSKFQDNKAVAGRNGLGASLANAFSTRFKIDLYNGTTHYSQTWTTHMVRNDPIIVPSNRPPWTQIEYDLDLPCFFGMEEYSLPLQKFLTRVAVETVVMAGVPFTINGKAYPILPFEKFCKMFVPHTTPSFHYYDADTRTDLVLMDTPTPILWSAVNGQATIKHGTHVKQVYEIVSERINRTRNEKRQVETNDLKPYLSIFISVRVIAPKYTNQAKEHFKSAPPKFTLPPSFDSIVKKWELLAKIDAHIDFRIEQVLSATDGGKSTRVKAPNYSPANWAGGPKSHECWLWYVEGVSAKGYAGVLREKLPGGVNTNGDLASGGKIPNALNTSLDKLFENDHIKWLKGVLGLRERIDYTIEENFRTLNYGHLVIASDADDDGIHIASLVILFMFCRYPSLVARGFVYRWESPVVRLTKKNEILRFYRLAEYVRWREEHPNETGWKPEYLKGLASSDKKDIHDDARIRKMTMELPDEETPSALRLAFDNELSNARKAWMERYIPGPVATPNEVQTISRFIADDHILYTFTALVRAIPNLEDFLKESQRKLLHTAINENAKTFIKVANFASRAADKTDYHFGPTNLMKATVKMAQTFPGSNNLPIMDTKGNFGDRRMGGKNAGEPRYIFVKLNWWVPLIFRDEDNPLLTIREDEGEKFEPVTYRPILPIGLFNGFRGIAVGYSTFGPAHHPMAVCEAVLARIENRPFPPLTPWYRGLTGPLSLSTNGESFTSKGTITFDEKGIPHITELPVAEWTDDYRNNVLEPLIDEKKLKKYSTSTNMVDEVGLKLEGLTFQPTLQNLKLVKNISLTNQTLLDPQGKPINYKNSNNILDAWVALRLKAYEERKAYQLSKLAEKVQALHLRERFLYAVAVEKSLVILDRPDGELKAEMAMRGFPDSLLDIKSRNLTKEGMAKTIKDRLALEQKYSELYQRDVRDIWREEIREFMTEYRKHYSN